MKTFILLIMILGINAAFYAQNPSLNPVEGSKTYGSGIDIGSCRINILTVGYNP